MNITKKRFRPANKSSLLCSCLDFKIYFVSGTKKKWHLIVQTLIIVCICALQSYPTLTQHKKEPMLNRLVKQVVTKVGGWNIVSLLSLRRDIHISTEKIKYYMINSKISWSILGQCNSIRNRDKPSISWTFLRLVEYFLQNMIHCLAKRQNSSFWNHRITFCSFLSRSRLQCMSVLCKMGRESKKNNCAEIQENENSHPLQSYG